MTKSMNRPKPEQLSKPGLHDIRQTTKLYGATRRTPGQNPVPTDSELATRRMNERLELASSAIPVRNSTMRTTYCAPELSAGNHRAGALDAFKLPSRTFYGPTYLRGQ